MTGHLRTALLVGVIVVACGSLDVGVAGAGRASPDAVIDDTRIALASLPEADRRLVRERLPAGTRVAVHAATGRVRLLGVDQGAPLLRGDRVAGPTPGRRASASTVARAFLDRTGRLFGERQPRRDLEVTSSRRRASGSSVRLQQRRRGIEVLGAQLAVRLDDDGSVLAAAGELLPDTTEVTTTPRIGVARARRTAAAWVARSAGVSTAWVTARSEGLTIVDPGIVGGLELTGPRLAWSIDARAGRTAIDEPVHDQVLVDARTGSVLGTLPRVAAGLQRRVCDARSQRKDDFRCRGGYARREGQAATGVAQVDAAYRLMGAVDTYYRSRFGRDGLDDRGAPMVATVRYCSRTLCPYGNAFWEWGPQQAAFGNGWASADDIVGHEFTHGVLDHEARLFYTFQSGALNEGLADIFGELIDLSYSGGSDGASKRWLMGEDLPGGAVRDLRRPGRFGNPDRVGSPRYATGGYDHGGVHINSAIVAKTAVLIADGGTFNGVRVRGLGLTKMARIHYEVMTNLLTSASDFQDMASALVQGCLDLVPSTSITHGDCASVSAAVRATELARRPRSGGPRQASVCPAGTYVRTIRAWDFEDVPATRADWGSRVLHGTRNPWYYPQNPNGDPDWDGTWASSGSRNLFADDLSVATDAVMTLRTPVLLPAGARLRFEHGFEFDADSRHRYDGGVVEISVDGGAWTDARTRFRQGRYNGTLRKGSGNRLGGRRAFTARSRGWGASRLDLGDLAGHEVRIRFRVVSDRSSGDLGWYIDDVRLYRCVTDTQVPTVRLDIDDGAESTDRPLVSLALEATDADAGVSRLRISNAPTTKDGLLSKAITMPFRSRVVEWSLVDPTYGGTDQRGTRTVYVQVRDRAGNWSKVARDTIVLD
ncbi:MAG: M4 family metallopeptidase [Chloroflexi bacterium]|nr:M4 family metallopeptidase [Chloroflexota bacterium]